MSVAWMLAVTATPAVSQSSIVGTVYDSLSVHGPLSNAVVVLVERSQYATTDAGGRFRFEDVPVGRYSLGVLHAVLDSFDLVTPLRVVEVANGTNTVVALATPSAASAYMRGCATRLADVANKSEVVAYLKIGASCSRLARRAARETAATRGASDSTARTRPDAQMLQPVVVRDTMRSMSPMAMYGFEDRRRLGLGKFVTTDDLAKHHYESLAALLGAVQGVRVEWGTSGQPTVYLRGNKEGSCHPTYFVDGALFNVPLPTAPRPDAKFYRSVMSDISGFAPPSEIKGIEVYSTSGVIPAQFDYSSSTGCGSIVIWTR
jgi:hypothetical protein